MVFVGSSGRFLPRISIILYLDDVNPRKTICISSISENLPQWPGDVPHWMLQGMFLYLSVLKEHYLNFFPHSDVGWVACGKDNKVKKRQVYSGKPEKK